jgi:hypothetical protein
MDRAGILIDGGFQCCDFWQLAGNNLTQHQLDLLRLSALTIGQRLRNHPSVINYSWSDNAPVPSQEKVSVDAFKQADFQDPLISSAEYNTSPLLGNSGEKEGPYDWVPPAYWYDTTHFDPTDSTRTNVGGSWALDSEQSAGHTVPTLDSIRRFLSPAEQDALWKNPSYNQYHANYEQGTTGYAFGTLFNLDTAVSKRYGSWSSLTQYVQQAQVQNYENTRAQFEAFIDHSTNTAVVALQQRLRPGRVLLRRQEGQRGPARALRPGRRPGDGRQPGRGRAGRAVGAGQGVRRGGQGARRPDRVRAVAERPAGQERRHHAQGARRDRAARQGADLLRRAAAQAGRGGRGP